MGRLPNPLKHLISILLILCQSIPNPSPIRCQFIRSRVNLMSIQSGSNPVLIHPKFHANIPIPCQCTNPFQILDQWAWYQSTVMTIFQSSDNPWPILQYGDKSWLICQSWTNLSIHCQSQMDLSKYSRHLSISAKLQNWIGTDWRRTTP